MTIKYKKSDLEQFAKIIENKKVEKKDNYSIKEAIQESKKIIALTLPQGLLRGLSSICFKLER